ncbi:hypothetical protein [Pedobacter africanus]|uniref:Uncharacterized protein n=1 Tax=Pedobacter africanus TaxID=151894 RepID=A0A1W2BRF6_9SPHI|nr:hypothetical protein [Pedobacter africanus]SMC75533.1 hypothetical protein SAMN04488524_2581 [Pedobacter africanus]
MKKIYTLILAVSSLAATAQNTNTFPTSGNVGIGTTSPTELLTVSGMNPIRGTFLTLDDQAITDRTGVRIRFQSKGIAHWNMGIPADVDAFTINGWSGAANPEYFRINSSGNVGIGTVSPSSLLHINGITSVRNNTLTDGYLTINPGGPTTQGYINWWKPGDIRVAYMGYNDGSGVNNLGLTLENASFKLMEVMSASALQPQIQNWQLMEISVRMRSK